MDFFLFIYVGKCNCFDSILLFCRADEWDINKWAWEGVLKVVSKGEECIIRLEDKTTGMIFSMLLNISMLLFFVHETKAQQSI